MSFHWMASWLSNILWVKRRFKNKTLNICASLVSRKWASGHWDNFKQSRISLYLMSTVALNSRNLLIWLDRILMRLWLLSQTKRSFIQRMYLLAGNAQERGRNWIIQLLWHSIASIKMRICSIKQASWTMMRLLWSWFRWHRAWAASLWNLTGILSISCLSSTSGHADGILDSKEYGLYAEFIQKS